ncbi:DUF3368 domain-containing protein [candidate division CSSED10-310 bacterium]|uniref:DUF3368 domain-containing protein n=1 Tax=candidate division CSSED10-310 bacterium TaxID=2855610 RepID=A0ABV6YYF6_UNCC1
MIVIANTTPFISLAAIGKLDLLEKIYQSIIIPEAVFDEIQVGGNITVPNLSSFNWINIAPNISDAEHRMLYQLDFAEKQVILHAMKMNAHLVIIDERLARNIAEYIGFKVKGSLGILAEAKKKNLIPHFYPCAIEMKQKGIRFSEKLINEIARTLGEKEFQDK